MSTAEATLTHLQALYQIVCEADEADIIRIALSALTSTPQGREYLEMNPIRL